MTFDWFTLVAQLVNFGLLILLLRLFLYKPVLNVMEQREQRLRSRWDEAERLKGEAEAEAARLAEANAELERSRRQRLEAAKAEAEELRTTRLKEAEREVARERERQLAALAESRERLADDLQVRSARLLVEELEASLKELADESLEERTVERFIARLDELDEESVAELRTAALSARPVVNTAYELEEPLAARLTEAVELLLDGGEPPTFETDESLLFGVELAVGAMRLSFSGRDRLAALGAAFDAAIGAAAKGGGLHEREA